MTGNSGLSFAGFAAALALWAPRVAHACSVCGAGRDDETRTAFLITTGFLTVLPLLLVGGVAWWLRRRARELEETSPSSPRRSPVGSLEV